MSTENIVPNNGAETTKVYYYLDDDPTPYMSVIQSGTETATLGHFKKAFTRKGFTYYGKLFDNDSGREVKVELTKDGSKLIRSSNGLIELFLQSSGNGINGGTLQRKNNGGTLPRRIGRERNDKDDDNIPSIDNMVHGGSSLPSLNGRDEYDCNSRPGTLISRRAGEGLAECYTSASEQAYPYNSRQYMCGSIMDERGEMDTSRRRKPRKNKGRKSYVPSTIGSQQESSGTSLSLPRILEVKLHVGPNDILGISVVSVEGSILVSDVYPGGVISRDGRIDVGDQIVQVNSRSFENLSDNQAIMILRRVAAAKKPLTLYVAKRCMGTSHENETLDTLASETLPLDISLWVENAVHCTQRQRFGVDDSCVGDTLNEDNSICTEDDEEERLLYAERRNGIGRRIMDEQPNTRKNDHIQDGVYNERLHCRMNPMTLINIMARPNSGLSVKNRKWLKIPVPQSFIGCELVDWLMKNVEDLNDKKGARQYASILLEKGFIRHVVNKKEFTEKCYYVFNDGVLSCGSSSNQGDSIGDRYRDGTTEVTYATSPPMDRVNHQSTNDHTWPFSPITVINRGGIGHRADCESDYASMVGGGGDTHSSSLFPPFNRNQPPNTPLSPSSTCT